VGTVSTFRLLVFRAGQVVLILVNLRVSPVNRLQKVLHLFVLLSVDCVIKLVDEEIVILLLTLLLLLFECLEVLLTLLHDTLLRNKVERRWHLFRNLWPLDLAHGLSHLLLVRI
jgi:hypothetical protein